MKNIKIVGVVGAGTMGSALAQKFAQEGFTVILADRSVEFIDKGINNIKTTLAEAAEKKVFTNEQIDYFLKNISTTTQLEDLKICDLIVEAIFENKDAKMELFKSLDKIVDSTTIIATNTSSFSVTELAASVSNPERFVGLHYFYHAAKNRLVEIIPGKQTSKATLKTVQAFSTLTGKDAIFCEDSYGFVVNRYFVPWLNEAVRLLEENIGNIATIDQVCTKIFGISMGPFALMNATGVSVAYHAQKTLEVFGSLYTVSDTLKEQTEAKQNWNLQGEIIESEEIQKEIADRMLGVVFLVSSQLLDEKVCTATEINRGARIGLQWQKGPIELMNKLDTDEVKKLIEKVSKKYNTTVPNNINKSNWNIQTVQYEVINNKAIITINNPENLNALNEQTIRELDIKFSEAEKDKNINTIFITGSGKAFVAGADIKFFVQNIKANKIDNIVAFTTYGQKVFEKIDTSFKKVVVIINGLALGGGLELALCADVILATPKATMAFPETGIGIYPGLGGTWRSKRKVGKPIAKYLVATGKMLNTKDAKSIGLVDEIVSLEQAINILNNTEEIPSIDSVELGEKWVSTQLFFEKYSIHQMLNFSNELILNDEQLKIVNTLKHKAPLALKLTEEIMDSDNESKNELDNLEKIFTTTDALLGLSNIGKKVVFEGK